jgi:hypothetical protein
MLSAVVDNDGSCSPASRSLQATSRYTMSATISTPGKAKE